MILGSGILITAKVVDSETGQVLTGPGGYTAKVDLWKPDDDRTVDPAEVADVTLNWDATKNYFKAILDTGDEDYNHLGKWTFKITVTGAATTIKVGEFYLEA